MKNKKTLPVKRHHLLPQKPGLFLRFIVLLLMCFSNNSLFSQIQWNKDFFGRDTLSHAPGLVVVHDYSAVSVRQFRDGFLYLAGTITDTTTNTPYGAFSKIDHSGTIVWGQKFRENSQFVDLRIVDSTKILLLGMASDTNYTNAVFLTKVDSSGAIIWKRKYTENDTDNTKPIRVIDSKRADTTEGYVIVAEVDSNKKVLFIKADKNNGTVLAQNSFELISGKDHIVKDMIQTADGNFVIGGYYTPGFESFIAKISQDLDSVLWIKKISILDGSGINGILEVDSMGSKHLYCIGNVTQASPTLNGMFVLKASQNADTIKWCRVRADLNGMRLTYSQYDSINFIASWPTNSMGVLGKVAASGASIQVKRAYDYNSAPSLPYSIQEVITTKDGGFAIAGFNIYPTILNRSTVSLIKTDHLGITSCSSSIASPVGPEFLTTPTITASTASEFAYSYDDTISGTFDDFINITYRPCSVICDTTALTHTIIGDSSTCDHVVLKAQSSQKYNYYNWTNYITGKTIISYEDTITITQSGKWTLQALLSPSCTNNTNSSAANVTVKSPKPNAGFDTAYTACFNYVEFEDTSTIDSTGKIKLRIWSFNHPSFVEDSITVGEKVYFKYSDTGDYVVRLVVISDKYCTDTAFVNLRVDTIGPNPPLELIATSANWSPTGVNDLQVTQNLPPLTQYSSYTWYRNGMKLFGPCNCPTYNAKSPGDYKVEALGDCGYEISNTVSLRPACDPGSYNTSFANNGNPPTGTYNDPDGYYIGANEILLIDNPAVHFVNTTLIMDECSEIRVAAGGALQLTDVKVVSCSSWQGILVTGNTPQQAQSPLTHGYLSMKRSYLSDAAIGIYSANGGNLDLYQDTFENNYVHIGVGQYNKSYSHNSSIDSCSFGQNHTFPSNDYANTPCLPSWWSGPPVYQSLSGSAKHYQPLVYLDSVRSFVFIENDYQYNRFYAPSGPLYDFRNNQVGLLLHDVDSVNVQLGRFYGTHEIGLVMSKGGDSARNYLINNHFNGHPDLLASSIMQTGSVIEETQHLLFDGNDYRFLPIGVEYYNNGNPIRDTIERSYFISNSHGLVISPRQWPITNDSVNTDTAQINVLVKCNQFKNNGYAFVGSGNIIEQRAGSFSSDADIGNLFEYSREWDLIWQDYSTPIFRYFTVDSILLDSLNANTLNSAIILNGKNLTQSTFDQRFSIVDTTGSPLPIDENGCRAFFSKMNWLLSNADKITDVTEAVTVFPNPFNSQVYVKFKEELSDGKIVVFDILGRSLLQQKIEGTIPIISLEHLPEGLYILVIKDGQEIIHTEKLLKTNRQ